MSVTRGQDVVVPSKVGEVIVEVLGVTPGAVLVDLMGRAVQYDVRQVKDLQGRPVRLPRRRPIDPRFGR